VVDVVSRVQQFAESLGPTSIMFGSDDAHRAYLQDRHSTSHKELRGPLRTYANLHPSDEIRRLGREVESAVGSDLSATIYLLAMRGSRPFSTAPGTSWSTSLPPTRSRALTR
jgi:hypothetical protein